MSNPLIEASLTFEWAASLAGATISCCSTEVEEVYENKRKRLIGTIHQNSPYDGISQCSFQCHMPHLRARWLKLQRTRF